MKVVTDRITSTRWEFYWGKTIIGLDLVPKAKLVANYRGVQALAMPFSLEALREIRRQHGEERVLDDVVNAAWSRLDRKGGTPFERSEFIAAARTFVITCGLP